MVASGDVRHTTQFFVACYATLHPAFVGPPVRQSVRPLIAPSHFTFLVFFAIFDFTAPAQTMKRPQLWPLPTHTRPGSCVSGLVFPIYVTQLIFFFSHKFFFSFFFSHFFLIQNDGFVGKKYTKTTV